jgi:hypothetical protein
MTNSDEEKRYTLNTGAPEQQPSTAHPFNEIQAREREETINTAHDHADMETVSQSSGTEKHRSKVEDKIDARD